MPVSNVTKATIAMCSRCHERLHGFEGNIAYTHRLQHSVW